MTTVEKDNSESAQVLPKVDAHGLDKRIREAAESVQLHWQALVDLVDEAKAGQIHVALGYGSWTEYLADAVQKPLRALGDRPAVVSMLSDHGMSNRGIAEVVGVDKRTVGRDLDQVGHNAPPAPKVGRDGKTYPYSPPQPKTPAQKPRRTRYSADIAMCQNDLRELEQVVEKAIRRLENLRGDDRYAKHREDIERVIRNAHGVLGWQINKMFPPDVVDAEVVDEGGSK